jgi:hypothetical protein
MLGGMQASHPTPTDPTALVESLDAEAIRARLADLDRQARALRVLLRAARARQRDRGPTDNSTGGPTRAA